MKIPKKKGKAKVASEAGPAFKLQTGKATQYLDTDSGQTLLNVPFEITDEEGTVVHAMGQSFPLTATQDEIKEVLERHLAVYTADHASHEAAKDFQSQLDSSSA